MFSHHGCPFFPGFNSPRNDCGPVWHFMIRGCGMWLVLIGWWWLPGRQMSCFRYEMQRVPVQASSTSAAADCFLFLRTRAAVRKRRACCARRIMRTVRKSIISCETSSWEVLGYILRSLNECLICTRYQVL